MRIDLDAKQTRELLALLNKSRPGLNPCLVNLLNGMITDAQKQFDARCAECGNPLDPGHRGKFCRPRCRLYNWRRSNGIK